MAEGYEFEAEALLIEEPDNPYDENAVMVQIDGLKVGHLARNDAKRYRRRIASLGLTSVPIAVDAVIVGGWDRGEGRTGHYGVKLDMQMPPKLLRRIVSA